MDEKKEMARKNIDEVLERHFSTGRKIFSGLSEKDMAEVLEAFEDYKRCWIEKDKKND